MPHKKHFLFLNRSFWPDIEATGQFLTELCEELSKSYQITVIAGSSYYIKKQDKSRGILYRKEKFHNISILRVRHTGFWKGRLSGRFLNWITFGLAAFLVGSTQEKVDLVVSCTDPPVMGLIGMIISRIKGAKFIYNCQDLYPDVAWGLGVLKKDSLLGRGFDYLNKKALSAADLVIPLGKSMRRRLESKGVSSERIRVIPHWADISNIRLVNRDENPLRKQLGIEDKFILMHSGNIGLSQEFNFLLKTLRLLRDNQNLVTVFIGDGASKDNLVKQVKLMEIKNILFLPYQAKEFLSFSLGMADLHLITLKRNLSGAIVPSKMYGIMAAGRPYLALTDTDSEAAYLAQEESCGVSIDLEDVEAIKESIIWAMNHPRDLEEMGMKGREVAEKRFAKEKIVNAWSQALTGVLR